MSDAAIEMLFESARTHKAWLDRPISDETLHQLYERLKWAPTSANTNPGRFVFVRSPEAKERLRPCLPPQNVEKAMTASICVIVASDTQFYDHLPVLAPGRDMRQMFVDAPAMAAQTATQSATLQGGYLILAARSLGLDCGPMAGFDRAATDGEFFPDGRFRSEFLINLGLGNESKLAPRAPRLAFDQACQIV